MTRARWLALAAFLAALIFALQGGEYSTFDLIQLAREERALVARVAELERAIDSLARVATALEQDPRTQERVARESFGMIRHGEFLYKLVPSSDTTAP